MAADITSTLQGWSASPASNEPQGATAISTNLDDNLRQIQAVVRKYLATKGADLASGTTTDLSTTDGNFIDITGTTTITGFGTLSAGMWKVLQFDGALTLTHNATSLILPGAANITTAAGDCLFAVSLGTGNWLVPFYQHVSGYVTPAGTQTLTNKTLTTPTITSPVINTAITGSAIASVAQQRTGTAVDVVVTPGRASDHPSAAKAWVNWDSSSAVPTINGTAYNVTSLTDNGQGDVTVVFTNALPSTNYCLSGTGNSLTTTNSQTVVNIAGGSSGSTIVTKTTGQVRVLSALASTGTPVDLKDVSVTIFGTV